MYDFFYKFIKIASICFIVIFIGALFFVGVYFAYNVFRVAIDPCYGTREKGKGGMIFEVREDSVCTEHGPIGYNSHNVRMKTLKGADPKTFKEMDYSHFVDKNHVYHNNLIISDDPENFKHLGGNYYRDSSKIYKIDHTIDADFETFEVLGEGNFAKDKNRAYYGYNSVLNVDIETFMALGHHYAKDKNFVYYTLYGNDWEPPILSGADPETFEVSTNPKKQWGARDKDRLYKFGKVVEELDADVTF